MGTKGGISMWIKFILKDSPIQFFLFIDLEYENNTKYVEFPCTRHRWLVSFDIFYEVKRMQDVYLMRDYSRWAS